MFVVWLVFLMPQRIIHYTKHGVLHGVLFALAIVVTNAVFLLPMAMTLQAETADGNLFFDLPQECAEAGITSHSECKMYMEHLKDSTVALTDFERDSVVGTSVHAIPETYATSLESYDLTQEHAIRTPSQIPVVEQYDLAPTDVYTTTDFVPEECSASGITDLQTCDLFLQKQEQEIDQYTLKKSFGNVGGIPTASTSVMEDMPRAVPDAPHIPARVYDTESPEGYMPSVSCKEARITDPIACKRYMEELRLLREPLHDMPYDQPRYEEIENPLDELSAEDICHTKGITDHKECTRFMARSEPFIVQQYTAPELLPDTNITDVRRDYLPPECIDAHIDSVGECKKFFMQRYEGEQHDRSLEGSADHFLPPACLDAGALTEGACRKVMTFMSVSPECREKGITDPEECERHFEETMLPFVCKERGLNTPEECEQWMTEQYMPTICIEKGLATKEECESYLLETTEGITGCSPDNPAACKYHIREEFDEGTFMPDDAYDDFDFIPIECREQGVTDFEACERLMYEMYAPQECLDAGIHSRVACERHIFELFETLPPEEAAKTLPKPCQEAGSATLAECDVVMTALAMPPECQEAGFNDPQACEEYMQQQHMPEICRKRGITDQKHCAEVMQAAYLPTACKKAALADPEACHEFMAIQYLPVLCREEGLASAASCDAFLKKQFLPQVCVALNITGESDCEQHIAERYTEEVHCFSEDKEVCHDIIKERRLGHVSEIKERIDEHNELVEDFVSKQVILTKDEGGDEEKVTDFRSVLPVAIGKIVAVTVIPAKSAIALQEDETIEGVVAAAVVFDADGDGLTDDMEARFGSDPLNSDTDGDGFTDGVEVKNGYDPVVVGERARVPVAPIDVALLNLETLEHPRIQGEERGDLLAVDAATVEKEVADTEDGRGSLTLAGTAVPDAVVTLYIYSTLPMVLTVQADEFGNWNYTLDQSLVDGGHEVYATITDDTGKVVSKSKPFGFLVQEAQAATLAELTEPAKRQLEALEEAAPESHMRLYGIGALALVLVGITLFVIIRLQLSRRWE